MSTTRSIMTCNECLLDGGPFASAEEATVHAATHDQLHHRGTPTAAAVAAALHTEASAA